MVALEREGISMMMGIMVMLAAGLGLTLTGFNSRRAATLDDETAEYLRQTTTVRSSQVQMRKLARLETKMQDHANYGVARIVAGLLLIGIGAGMLLLGIY